MQSHREETSQRTFQLYKKKNIIFLVEKKYFNIIKKVHTNSVSDKTESTDNCIINEEIRVYTCGCVDGIFLRTFLT